MKSKTKRVGSFLCFSSPDSDDNEKKQEKRKQRELKVSPEVGRNDKKNRRRLMSKIVKSISFKSSSRRGGKLQKDPNRSLTRETSETSANKCHSESFGKNSDETSSPSSATTTTCCSSSSCTTSSSSSYSSASCPSHAASWQGKKTFMPPPVSRNYGYATGLFLVLLSLFVVVLCGRLCAILWTATWLYIVPRWRINGKPSGLSKAAAEVKRKGGFWEEEEKNRIFMEGFFAKKKILQSELRMKKEREK